MSPKLLEEPAVDDAALAGVPVVLVPTVTGVRVGFAVGVGVGGVGVAVGTTVGAGSGVDVAIGMEVDMGAGSDSSAVPHAAMSDSRTVSRMAMVVVLVPVVVRMPPMVLEWRLTGNFTSMDKVSMILVSG